MAEANDSILRKGDLGNAVRVLASGISRLLAIEQARGVGKRSNTNDNADANKVWRSSDVLKDMPQLLLELCMAMTRDCRPSPYFVQAIRKAIQNHYGIELSGATLDFLIAKPTIAYDPVASGI